MECASRQQIEAWLRENNKAALEAFRAHIRDCQPCRERAAEAAERLLVQEVSQAGGHCDSPLLSRYLDEDLPPHLRLLVELHLGMCPKCRALLENMRAKRQEAQAHPQTEWNYQPVLEPVLEPILTHGRWQTAHPLLPWTFAATGAFAALLLFWFMARPLQHQVTLLQTERERLRQEAILLRIERERLSARVAQAEASRDRAQQSYAVASSALARLQAERTQRDTPTERAPSLGIRDAEGNPVGLETLPRSVQEAWRREQIRTPAILASLTSKRETLLGSQEGAHAFALHRPVGVVVAESRPVFQWQRLPDTTRYTLTIIDDAREEEIGQFRIAANGNSDEAITEKMPTTLPPLQPGRIYRWFVTATLSDGREVQSPNKSAPVTRFKVLEHEKAASLRRVKQTSSSPLIPGTLYAQEGLLYEAEAEFQALVKQNPRSDTARKLLQSIQKLLTKRP